MSAFEKIACHLAAWPDDRWEQALDESAEIGYCGVECGAECYTTLCERTEELQERFKEHSLQLSAIEYQADVIYPDRKNLIVKNAVPYLEFLKRLKSNLVIIHTGQREVLQEKKLDFKIAAETLNELGSVCLDHDCFLCVMTRQDSRIADEEDIDRLMNLVDLSAVFLGIDTAHLQAAGQNSEHIINTYGECLKHVRLQDIYPEGEEPEEGERFCALGEGGINFRPVIKALDQFRYDGWLTVALDSQVEEPAEQMETSWNTLQKWIEQKDEPEPEDPFAYGGLSFR